MRTRVKICGITRVEDGLAAAQAGADAIGFVFYAGSPRYVDPERARTIRAALPPFVATVGVFVNAGADEVRAIVDRVDPHYLQFHGEEAPEACRSFGRPYVKAIRVRPGADVAAAVRPYADAVAWLLDTYVPDIHGGTGSAFDWAGVPTGLERPIVLAGGLTAACVGRAIALLRPYAVDVSGGVERAPGIKDAEKMRAFIEAVKQA